MAEAAQPRELAGLAFFSAKASENLPAAAKQPMTQNLQKNIQAPDYRNVALDKAKIAAQLAAFQPSPLKFETDRGYHIPVVRITEQLNKLDVKDTEGIQLDGKVTTAEAALTWKTGRLRMHSPSSPPPEGNPATYCYVGKTEYQGRPHLYVAFVCMDDNLNQLVLEFNPANENSYIFRDDSVEVYLDIDQDSKDFHQLIANARGQCWHKYLTGPHQFNSWDAAATVKTTLNQDAGQWTCEILVPFDRLGGVPAKGARWQVNFCRNFRGQDQPWKLQSWFQVYSGIGDYHHPSLFGVFEW